MGEHKHINVSISKGVMHIGIHRPDKKNALTGGMYDAMRLALETARGNPEVKTVLIHGVKDAFSAGNDLKEFDVYRDPDTESSGVQFLKVLQGFEKPVVAAVSGIAVGIGVTLLLHCDLVYAASDTRFRMPFVNLGVCPEAGSTLLLPAGAGYKKAAEVLMLGNFFDTLKAMELGVVNGAVPPPDVLDYSIKIAEQLAQKPQQALLLTKQLLKQGNEQELIQRMALEFKCFAQLLGTPESIEARGKMQSRFSPEE